MTIRCRKSWRCLTIIRSLMSPHLYRKQRKTLLCSCCILWTSIKLLQKVGTFIFNQSIFMTQLNFYLKLLKIFICIGEGEWTLQNDCQTTLDGPMDLSSNYKEDNHKVFNQSKDINLESIGLQSAVQTTHVKIDL